MVFDESGDVDFEEGEVVEVESPCPDALKELSAGLILGISPVRLRNKQHTQHKDYRDAVGKGKEKAKGVELRFDGRIGVHGEDMFGCPVWVFNVSRQVPPGCTLDRSVLVYIRLPMLRASEAYCTFWGLGKMLAGIAGRGSGALRIALPRFILSQCQRQP